MTIAEKKLKLIQAISELEDENTLDKILAVIPEEVPQGFPEITFPVKTNFNFLTVEEINDPTFIYHPIKKESVIGGWPSDEPIEELTNMLTK